MSTLAHCCTRLRMFCLVVVCCAYTLHIHLCCMLCATPQLCTTCHHTTYHMSPCQHTTYDAWDALAHRRCRAPARRGHVLLPGRPDLARAVRPRATVGSCHYHRIRVLPPWGRTGTVTLSPVVNKMWPVCARNHSRASIRLHAEDTPIFTAAPPNYQYAHSANQQGIWTIAGTETGCVAEESMGCPTGKRRPKMR
jgi:hypothetical protein